MRLNKQPFKTTHLITKNKSFCSDYIMSSRMTSHNNLSEGHCQKKITLQLFSTQGRIFTNMDYRTFRGLRFSLLCVMIAVVPFVDSSPFGIAFNCSSRMPSMETNMNSSVLFIVPNATAYNPGGSIIVVCIIPATNSVFINELKIHARRASEGNVTTPVGSFGSLPTEYCGRFTCSLPINETISKNNNSAISSSLTFSWTPPITGVGDIVFIATVLSNNTEDWSVESPTVVENNTPPTIQCPIPVLLEKSQGDVDGIVRWSDPICSDAEQNDSLSLSCRPSSGSSFPVDGNYTIVCTCSDDQRLFDTCTFPVTVITANNPPNITCPAFITTESLPYAVGNIVTWPSPLCQDDGEDYATRLLNCDPPSGSFLSGIQQHRVTCNCSDSYGLFDTCVFYVDLTPANKAPEIDCPDPITVYIGLHDLHRNASSYEPRCTDAEQEDATLTMICDQLSDASLSNVQQRQVTCTCLDEQGLSDTCIFFVRLREPSITCPTQVIYKSSEMDEGTLAYWNDAVCIGGDGTYSNVTVTCTKQSGDIFIGNGTFTVTCTCEETNGLQDTCLIVFNIGTKRLDILFIILPSSIFSLLLSLFLVLMCINCKGWRSDRKKGTATKRENTSDEFHLQTIASAPSMRDMQNYGKDIAIDKDDDRSFYSDFSYNTVHA